MEIQELISLKKQVEADVAKVLNEFSENTGLGINDLTLTKFYKEDGIKPVSYIVHTEISI